MPPIPNPEGKPIGPLLKAHRVALEVSDEDMIRQGGQGLWWELKWTQNAQKPSELRVRQYHHVVLEVLENRDAPPGAPGAFVEQWYATDYDTALLTGVRERGRRVAWWWAGQRTQRGAGAQCHVCNTLIHAYDLSRGMTHPARVGVMHHRARHVNELIQAAKRPGENKVNR